MESAAIVIVGDEILAGHTQDTNSHWLAKRLRSLGLRLARVETIPDRVAAIESTLRRLVALEHEWVLIVGGLGPTPDDRTYEAVGRALGVPLEAKPEHVKALKERAAVRGFAKEPWADPETSHAMRRMVEIPAGSMALPNPVGAALGCVALAGRTRIVVLPGVPRELVAMFDESFAPEHLAGRRLEEASLELEVFGAEASYWDALVEVERAFPGVQVGSYPQDETGRVILRATGRVAEAQKAIELLAALIKR